MSDNENVKLIMKDNKFNNFKHNIPLNLFFIKL